MSKFIDDASILTSELVAARKKVYNARYICASPERAVFRKKLFFSYINEVLYKEVRVFFRVNYIWERKYEIMNVVNSDTRYGEQEVAPGRNAETMRNLYDTLWLYLHGTPK